jgi:hypothetical protein
MKPQAEPVVETADKFFTMWTLALVLLVVPLTLPAKLTFLFRRSFHVVFSLSPAKKLATLMLIGHDYPVSEPMSLAARGSNLRLIELVTPKHNKGKRDVQHVTN